MSYHFRHKSAPVKGRFFTHTVATQPRRVVQGEAEQCGFCSQPALARCEYPQCQMPVCKRCRIRKGGGDLCRRHRKARLVQVLGVPMIGDVAMRGLPSTRFKAKGPAVPHERGAIMSLDQQGDIRGEWIRYTMLLNHGRIVEDTPIAKEARKAFIAGAASMFRIMVENVAKLPTAGEQQAAKRELAEELRSFALECGNRLP